MMAVNGSLDFVKTVTSVIRSTSLISDSLSGELSFQRTFPTLVLRQKLDADLIAGHPHHSTAAKRETRRRQQQKEFLDIQSFEGSFDAQSRARLRYVDHDAVTAPASINSHDVNADAAVKIDALAFSVSIRHL